MKITKSQLRQIIKEEIQNELLTERNMDAYNMVDKYRELQRRMWYSGNPIQPSRNGDEHPAGEGPNYLMWRLQTVNDLSPEKAEAEVEKMVKKMEKAADGQADVIMTALEDRDTLQAFGAHIGETVKDPRVDPKNPKSQRLSKQDRWTPWQGDQGPEPDYAKYKEFLKTRRQNK
jgi:hypothetical protein